MKNSFSLLITLILISIFSFFTILILQTKSLSISNLTNSYLQTQAKLHMDFFKNYINSINLKDNCIENLYFNNDIYKLKAKVTFEKGCLSTLHQNATIDIFVNAKTLNNEITLHEQLIKEL
ncbi:conserved hypothetical protein [Arcobacter nitrofigilis DSM 7299]|uniref:Uncharacterized protein n=1 Tax=Arcobacter nitrofigilis (strain ATCC 33309 / DSM 7299 / CCUG 15893 / LMG 7604 / NCTC 12251 / CI) TaxID=572480 RepID=D5V2Q4_ARCNC|nr:hypothetical protein [Arcobacter nitrofigilis]ADG92486.1 conserved hypothetical protein [Arcobacter nitrofigilis DSM 7299]